MKWWWMGCLCVVLMGCDQRPMRYALPVSSPHIDIAHPDFVRVAKGDTLYALAWRYQLDVSDLIHYNHLRPPYRLSVDQILHLSRPAHTHQVVVHHVAHHTHAKKAQSHHPAKAHKKHHGFYSKKPPVKWCQPMLGRMKNARHPYHGLWISHAPGAWVKASAAGKVMYAGTGMPGYGRLILIQHGGGYISAYGFNQRLLVTAGDYVNAGEKIAKSGQNMSGKGGLYFELRRRGKPFQYRQLQHKLRRC